MYKRLPDGMTLIGLPRFCILWGKDMGDMGITIVIGRYALTIMVGRIEDEEEELSYYDYRD